MSDQEFVSRAKLEFDKTLKQDASKLAHISTAITPDAYESKVGTYYTDDLKKQRQQRNSNKGKSSRGHSYSLSAAKAVTLGYISEDTATRLKEAWGDRYIRREHMPEFADKIYLPDLNDIAHFFRNNPDAADKICMLTYDGYYISKDPEEIAAKLSLKTDITEGVARFFDDVLSGKFQGKPEAHLDIT